MIGQLMGGLEQAHAQLQQADAATAQKQAADAQQRALAEQNKAEQLRLQEAKDKAAAHLQEQKQQQDAENEAVRLRIDAFDAITRRLAAASAAEAAVGEQAEDEETAEATQAASDADILRQSLDQVVNGIARSHAMLADAVGALAQANGTQKN